MTAKPPVDLSIDGHIHTRLCNHATGEMEDYVKAAIGKGLRKIIFLEHLELDIQTPERIWLRPEDFEYYFAEGNRLRQHYRDSLEITLGMEVGLNPANLAGLDALVRSYPCEHVGLSYHFMFDGVQHLNMVSQRQENVIALAKLGVDKVLTSYFEGLQQGVATISNLKVVCHLDAVLRHYPNLEIKESHWLQIEALLDTMAAGNVALEINTSGFALPGEPYPKRELIRLAQQKNICCVAGSDAHCPQQVGRFFSKIPALL